MLQFVPVAPCPESIGYVSVSEHVFVDGLLWPTIVVSRDDGTCMPVRPRHYCIICLALCSNDVQELRQKDL